MRANQVEHKPEPFVTPKLFTGGQCAYPGCRARIKPGYGTHVGDKVYCNYDHFSLHIFGDDHGQR